LLRWPGEQKPIVKMKLIRARFDLVLIPHSRFGTRGKKYAVRHCSFSGTGENKTAGLGKSDSFPSHSPPGRAIPFWGLRKGEDATIC
jgi:hypothetical protein